MLKVSATECRGCPSPLSLRCCAAAGCLCSDPTLVATRQAPMPRACCSVPNACGAMGLHPRWSAGVVRGRGKHTEMARCAVRTVPEFKGHAACFPAQRRQMCDHGGWPGCSAQFSLRRRSGMVPVPSKYNPAQRGCPASQRHRCATPPSDRRRALCRGPPARPRHRSTHRRGPLIRCQRAESEIRVPPSRRGSVCSATNRRQDR